MAEFETHSANTPPTQQRIFCPLVFKNCAVESFALSSEVEIRKITNEEREAFFGLAGLTFDFSNQRIPGWMVLKNFQPSKNKKGRYPYTSILNRGMIDGSSDILAANHVAVLKEPRIDQINFALKLLRPTSSGIYVKFAENDIDVGYHYYNVLSGPFEYLSLKQEDIEELKRIFYLLIQFPRDKKFELCSSLYLQALMGDRNSTNIRFILLITALESMYLNIPKQQRAEKGFRLRLFVSNLLSVNGFGNAMDISNTMKDIYAIRSEIVHEGFSEELTKPLFEDAVRFVRLSLNLYLQDKNKFSNLEQLCLRK